MELSATRILRRPIPNGAPALTGLPPILQRLYQSRGIRSANELDLSLAQLVRPEGLGGLTTAVELLLHALDQQLTILVIGDYDADGATASALAVLALRACGAKHVDYLVPDRFNSGYGLSPTVVDQAAKRGADLLITVDTGIADLMGVQRALEHGLTVIITDHHAAGSILPGAHAIINPKLPGDGFGSPHTAGVGVAFYLMLALRARLRALNKFAQHGRLEPNFAALLDLVALGTVADLVPLDHNNRILVEQGLRRIRAGYARPGIIALLQIANRVPERVTSGDLAFVVAPRLNAAGRLNTMNVGIECLLCEDLTTAQQHAATLDQWNQERRGIETQMQAEAEIALEQVQLSGNDLPLGLCLYDERWHHGVVGLLASRLKDRYHRPTVALAPADAETLRGSARSIAGLHMRDLLADLNRQYPGLLRHYGGHAMAAGFTLERSQQALFTQAFNTAVHQHLEGRVPSAEIMTDGSLTPAEFNLETAKLLHDAPWGQGFPAPLFEGEFDICRHSRMQDIHLKLWLENVGSSPLEAVLFRWGDRPAPTKRVRLVYQLDVNTYQGRERLQLLIRHLETIPVETD